MQALLRNPSVSESPALVIDWGAFTNKLLPK